MVFEAKVDISFCLIAHWVFLCFLSPFNETENNQFTGTIDDGFLRDLPNLNFLDISDNFLRGTVKMHLFELPNLLVLDLHDNDFDMLPDELPMNTNLRMLALHKCNFNSQSIPTSIVNMTSLFHLDLSQNAFEGTIPPQIGSMAGLSYLFLAQNRFAPGPIPTWISGLTNLEELSLKSTSRTGTIPFSLGENLQRLILLDLDNNRLEGSIPVSLAMLRQLNILTLNRNNLTSALPIQFSSMSNLRKCSFVRSPHVETCPLNLNADD